MRTSVACVVGLVVGLLVALCGVAAAEKIYVDDFSGSGSGLLNGTAPDTRPGSETWIARTDAPAWYDDGTKTVNASSSAWLPFTPTAGNLYTLSLDVNPDISGSDDWFALGFSASNVTTNDFHPGPNNAVGWMLNRENDASGSVVQTFRGPSTGTGASHDFNPDKVGPVNLQVVLDTQPAQWTVRWAVDGGVIRSDTFPSIPVINYVGFGAYASATGVVDNFSLSSDFQSTPSSFLRRHWKMDDNAANTTVLNTISAPNATFMGANTNQRHAAGILGSGALSLNGTSDYIQVDDTADLDFAANETFTFLGWVKTTDANGMVASFRTQGGSGNPLVELGVWNGSPFGQIRDDNGGGLQTLNATGVTVNDDAWHHLAVRRRGDGRIELYSDGILVATSGGACTGPITTSVFRAIGSERRWVADNANSADQRYLGGLVDDIGIWDAALGPQEIALVHGLGVFAGLDVESPEIAAMLDAFNVQGLITLSNAQLWGYTTGLSGVTGAIGGSILTLDAHIVLNGALGSGMQFLGIVPEPATLSVLALGTLGLLRRRRRGRRAAGRASAAMARNGMKERNMRGVSLTILGLVVLAGLAQGGVLTLSPALTTDVASGINPMATYTHTISGGQAATVNSVIFAELDPSTTPPNSNWNTFTWQKSQVENNNNNWNPATGGVTGTGLQELFGDFTYSGNGTGVGNHQAFTLTGLTPGTTYDLRAYIRPWDVNYTQRLITLTYTNGGEVDATFISEDQPTVQGYPSNHSAYYMNYHYTAQGTSVTMDAAVAAGGAGSFHMYALSNQVAGPVPPFLGVNTASSSTGFSVSATDLINGVVPTVNDVNLIRVEEGATTNNPAALTNGAFGNPGIPGGPDEIVAIHNGAILTYNLDTAAYAMGYDITNIDVYSGWRDPGRDAQAYQVLYSMVSDPTTFYPLATVDYNPAGAPSPSDVATLLAMSDGSPMVSQVAALRFLFPVTENGYVGYREIDVFGYGLIPEPTSLSLLALGALGLLRRRRRM